VAINNKLKKPLHYSSGWSNAGETSDLIRLGSIWSSSWIQIRCGFGLGLLIGGLEWILVDGAPDLYPIRTAVEEE
jgi:hypothetical protein